MQGERKRDKLRGREKRERDMQKKTCRVIEREGVIEKDRCTYIMICVCETNHSSKENIYTGI